MGVSRMGTAIRAPGRLDRAQRRTRPAGDAAARRGATSVTSATTSRLGRRQRSSLPGPGSVRVGNAAVQGGLYLVRYDEADLAIAFLSHKQSQPFQIPQDVIESATMPHQAGRDDWKVSWQIASHDLNCPLVRDLYLREYHEDEQP